MNKHFEDARYYIKRAGETAKAGLAEELAPIEAKIKELTGRDEEPEPSRFDEIREELREMQARAEGETREAIEKTRERIDDYRDERRAE